MDDVKRTRKHCADLIQGEVGYMNGWAIDAEQERIACTEAADKVYKYLKKKMNTPLTIWHTSIGHRHGSDTFAGRTEAELEERVYQYVADNWGDEMHSDLEDMPEDHAEAIADYFATVEEVLDDNQFINLGRAKCIPKI